MCEKRSAVSSECLLLTADGEGLYRLDRCGEPFAGELFDVEFGSFEPGREQDGSALMVCFPHLVRRLGAGEAGQLHDAADNEHEIHGGVAMEDHLVAG